MYARKMSTFKLPVVSDLTQVPSKRATCGLKNVEMEILPPIILCGRNVVRLELRETEKEFEKEPLIINMVGPNDDTIYNAKNPFCYLGWDVGLAISVEIQHLFSL